MSTSLFFDIFGRDKGVGKMLDGVGDKAQGFGSRLSGAAAGATKLLGPLSAVVGTAAIAKFGTDSVRVFSGLEDAMGAASVVFGDSMKMIVEQSNSASRTLGMTKTQVIDAANTFGTFGKSAGLAGDDLALFSTDMTKLAGDMASFKGKTPEEAIDAIGSALRGESEPIRSFGVLLDDATLKNRALSMGLISTTKDALTPQQKVLAAQKEILAQTTDAQGDFARTQDSTANVAKRLSAETENLQAKIGSVLAPAFTNARMGALGFVESISGFVDRVGPGFIAVTEQLGPSLGHIKDILFKGDFTGGLFGLEEDSKVVDVLFNIREGFLTVVAALQPALPAFRELGPAVFTLISAFSPLSLVFNALAPVLPELANAAGRLAGELAGALAEAMRVLAPVITSVITGVADAVSWFTNLEGSGTALTLGLGIFVTALVAYHTVIGVVSMATKAWIAVQTALNFVMNMNPIGIVVIAISTLVAAVVLAYNNVGWFKDGVHAAWAGIQAAIGAVVGWFTGSVVPWFEGAFRNIGSAVSGGVRGFNEFKDGVFRAVDGAVGFVQSIPGRVTAVFAGAMGWLGQAGRNIIDGFLGGLKASWTAVTDFIGGIGAWIAQNKGPEAYDRALLVPAGGWIMGGLVDGIRRSMPVLGRQLADVSSLVQSGLGGAFSSPVLALQSSVGGTGGGSAAFLGGGASGVQPIVYVTVYSTNPLTGEQIKETMRVEADAAIGRANDDLGRGSSV